MEKFGLLKTVYMILVIDEAPAIDSPAQTLTTLHNFAVGNESAYPGSRAGAWHQLIRDDFVHGHVLQNSPAGR